jgi:hypothetical protein
VSELHLQHQHQEQRQQLGQRPRTGVSEPHGQLQHQEQEQHQDKLLCHFPAAWSIQSHL